MQFDLAFDRQALLTAYLLAEWAIRIGALVIVPFRRTPDAAKGWLLLILFEPMLGLIAYLVIGRRRLPAARIRRAAEFRARAQTTQLRFVRHSSS